jgi:hypothetical protein
MSRRQERLEGEIGVFMKQYGRQKHAGREPNDRRYDHATEQAIKQMDPIELDALLRGEFDEDADFEPWADPEPDYL